MPPKRPHPADSAGGLRAVSSHVVNRGLLDVISNTHPRGRALHGKTILVTGGTGSFGHRVATHLATCGPREVRIYSRDEKKQWEMQRSHPELHFIIGDIRDLQRLRESMKGVDYVFHAAALKHVPACEMYPYEAVKTNVIGSHNVCQAAKSEGVGAVVALSTDKAVNPLNAMGTSKAMMEKIVCSQNQLPSETRFCCVRYGNVMGSRGSVIPLFESQIAAGKPVTVTVGGMTRFLMTLNQSVDLVLEALLCAKGGEIFVRKAPACTVQLLAETMCRKYSPLGAAHEIRAVGIRPGEKMHEVLVNEYELQRCEEDDTYFTIHPEYRPIAPSRRTRYPLGAQYTSANTRRLNTWQEVAEVLDRMSYVEAPV